MRNYKIEFRRSGHTYGPSYCKTIAGAVKIARGKGWYDHGGGPERNWDGRPFSAFIFERVDDGWEHVATVTENGIQAEDYVGRRSYKLAEDKMKTAKACIERTYATMLAFNVIADKEFLKALR